MTEFDYTPEQRAAIFDRGSDLLVSAGAGSGKTSVLVQRIIEVFGLLQNIGELTQLFRHDGVQGNVWTGL